MLKVMSSIALAKDNCQAWIALGELLAQTDKSLS